MKASYDLLELGGHEFEVLEDSGTIVEFDGDEYSIEVNSVMFNGEDVASRLTEHEMDSIKDAIANGDATIVDDNGMPIEEPWSPTEECLLCSDKNRCGGNCPEPQKRED